MATSLQHLDAGQFRPRTDRRVELPKDLPSKLNGLQKTDLVRLSAVREDGSLGAADFSFTDRIQADADWVRSPLLEAYRSGVFQSTGLSLELRPQGKSEHTPKPGICLALANLWPACGICRQMQDRVARADGMLVTDRCPSLPDLVRCFRAIQIEGRAVATLCSGSLFIRPPIENLHSWMPGESNRASCLYLHSAARRAIAETPVVPSHRLAAVMQGCADLVEYVVRRAKSSSQGSRCVEPAAIVSARRFVEEHLDEPIALAALAREVDLTPFHFCRLFKKWVGVTLTNYVRRQRLRRAQALLEDPARRVTDVAMAAGFGSMARFYIAFKRETGLSPGEYRRRAVGRAATGDQNSSFPTR